VAQKLKLSWQAGQGRRAGRWKKRYRGKAYYFDGGTGKSDRDAYKLALEEWEKLKATVDATLPKPNEMHYLDNIEKWERVIAWCHSHNDGEMAAIATSKLERLRKELGRPKPVTLPKELSFDGHFELLKQELALPTTTLQINDFLEDREPEPLQFNVIVGSSPSEKVEVEKRIWIDRTERGVECSTETLVKTHVSRFLESKKNTVSPGRYSHLHSQLWEFSNWTGELAVDEITAQLVRQYFDEVLRKKTPYAARDAYACLRQFVRWLYNNEFIDSQPRNLDGLTNEIQIPAPLITVVSNDDIHRLLQRATSRTQLYLLLTLNCGMTQKDIADLTHAEVDWQNGRIIRRRSKTRKGKNTPEVNYLLWPATLRLLRLEASEENKELVLLNSNGGPLLDTRVTDAGKLKKRDNVRSAYERLRKKVGASNSLKAFRKTSATRMRSNKDYRGLETLFLGHSNRTVAEVHYAAAPQDLLDQAITWLAESYKIELALKEVNQES
jgi:integrase